MNMPLCHSLNNKSWDHIYLIYLAQHLTTLSLGGQAERGQSVAVISTLPARSQTQAILRNSVGRFFKKYLTVLDLSCSTQDLSLWCMDSSCVQV